MVWGMTRPCWQDSLTWDAMTKFLRDRATGRISLCPGRDANVSSLSLSLYNTRLRPAHTQRLTRLRFQRLLKAGVECDYFCTASPAPRLATLVAKLKPQLSWSRVNMSIKFHSSHLTYFYRIPLAFLFLFISSRESSFTVNKSLEIH